MSCCPQICRPLSLLSKECFPSVGGVPAKQERWDLDRHGFAVL